MSIQVHLFVGLLAIGPFTCHRAPAPGSSTDSGVATPLPSASAAYRFDAARGKQLYSQNCEVCHQSTGLGLPPAFPPLKGDPAVNDPDPTLQFQTVLNGVSGRVIGGTKFTGVMPPFKTNLSDAEVADLVNYERGAWGNHGDPVTPAQVAAVRAGRSAPTQP